MGTNGLKVLKGFKVVKVFNDLRAPNLLKALKPSRR